MTPAPSDLKRDYLLPQSVFPRGLAYLIDTAVVAVLTAVLMAAGVIRDGGLDTLDPNAIRDMLQSNAGLAVYLILFAYFLVFEGSSGRTVGKLALGLRVVRAVDGSPCGWGRSVIRNLIRPFDLFFVGLPGGLFVMFTPARQRVGDLLGGTLVVRQMTVPAAIAAVIPGMLRRCPSCGRLAPAAGPCPGCSAPPPAPPAPADAPFGAALLAPLAGMMAVGEAAGAVRTAAQDVLAAESVYGEASAAESARIGREGVPADEATEAPAATSGSVKVDTDQEAFVATADPHGLSDEYVDAWRGLMNAVEKLRSRRDDLDAALAKATVPLAQATASDPLLRELLRDVDPYLDADDDEAVLAAFMARTSSHDEAAGAGDPPSA
jgi:uncharacterized RDD family membrane protein YckC